MTESPVLFVYAPALYPGTPFLERAVFVHGKLVEVKIKPNETILKGEDAKGVWWAYVEQYVERYEIGQRVRAYGIITAQPDGNVSLAAKWTKIIEEGEYAYCEEQSRNTWETLQKEQPVIDTLPPFHERAATRGNPHSSLSPTAAKPTEKGEPEFIPADQLKVEREYI
ncbi:MAG: hypothetical protein AABW68_04225 [archaeon]